MQFFQVTAIAIFHEKVKIIGGLLNVVEADHIGTLQLRQYPDFTSQVFLEFFAESGLLDDFAR